MRAVQNLLVVIGAAALGAAAFDLAVLCYFLGQSKFVPGIAGVGLAGLAMLLYAGATVLGGVAGFIVALIWIRKRGSGPWNAGVWCGAAMGGVFAVALHVVCRLINGLEAPDIIGRIAAVKDVVELLAWPPAAVMLVPVFAMLGGIIATFVGARRLPQAGDRVSQRRENSG